MKTHAKHQFIVQSAEYFARHQRKSGKFFYRMRLDGGDVRSDYNVLRHAGAAYSLGQSLPFAGPTAQQTADRALMYLWRWYLVPVVADKLQFAIASAKPSKRNFDIAKLGGVGLAQIALATQQRELTEFEKDVARGLARFTYSMIAPDGSVTSKINIRTGAVSDFVSLYYPGEAALSLLLFAMRFDDDIAVEHALRILRYLSESRVGAPTVPPDHWALLATAEVFSLVADGRIDLEAVILEAFRFHAIQIVDKILLDADQAADPGGALTDNGQTCSSATRLEGLCAIFGYLATHGYCDLDRVRDCIDRGIAYLMNAQVASGPLAGGMPWVSPHHATYSTNPTAPEIRIDSVQHALSAVLGSLAMTNAAT